MDNPQEGKRKKALRMLAKLLKAAQKAQKEGKHVALEKIISEANKLSTRIEKQNDFTKVKGELVEDLENTKAEELEKIKKEKLNELELYKKTNSALKPEHNTLAIIAAKRDFNV